MHLNSEANERQERRYVRGVSRTGRIRVGAPFLFVKVGGFSPPAFESGGA